GITADQVSEAINVLRHEEGKLPGVSFNIMLVGTRLEGIEIGLPIAFGVFHPGIAYFRIDGISPPLSAIVEILIIFGFTECFGELPYRPIVETILHAIGITTFIVRYILMLEVGFQIAVACKT